jgi:aspartyl-tRNA(Asn)/glutamyl-tRNA(Gln) amidotransferase subunit A
VVGYKPSRNAIPTEGLLPLAPALDAVGVLAICVSDCLLADAALRGTTEHALAPLDGLRVGIERRLLEKAEPVVARSCEAALGRLSEVGVDIVECSLPTRGLALAPIYAADLCASWGDEVRAHPESYGEDVRQGIETGAAVLAVEYMRALRALEEARAAAELDVDVLACPACPILPPPFDAPDDVPTAGRFTRIFNLLDWPALVVPCGSPEEPVGLQLVSQRGNEAALFALATAPAGRCVRPPGSLRNPPALSINSLSVFVDMTLLFRHAYTERRTLPLLLALRPCEQPVTSALERAALLVDPRCLFGS